MKVLYCGTMGGTSKSRCEGLKALGFNVKAFDHFQHSYTSPLWFQRLENRNLNYLNNKRINSRLIDNVKEYSPDIIWIDKGTYIYKKTLEEIKSMNKKLVIVHHNTDDVEFSKHNFKNYFDCLDLYDAHFTSNKFNIDYLKKISNSFFFYNEIGYDHNIFKPRNQKINYDLFFIGHHEPEYELYISKLANKDIKFFLGGPGWYNSNIPKSQIRFNHFDEKLYQKIINQTKIGLGLYSSWNRNISSGRIFEIPASRVALVVKRNSFIEKLYIEDEEAIFFDSEKELNDKIDFLLKNPQKLNDISENGYKKCIANKCSWKDRVEEAVLDLKNANII